jgi:hypothetical protein
MPVRFLDSSVTSLLSALMRDSGVDLGSQPRWSNSTSFYGSDRLPMAAPPSNAIAPQNDYSPEARQRRAAAAQQMALQQMDMELQAARIANAQAETAQRAALMAQPRTGGGVGGSAGMMAGTQKPMTPAEYRTMYDRAVEKQQSQANQLRARLRAGQISPEMIKQQGFDVLERPANDEDVNAGQVDAIRNGVAYRYDLFPLGGDAAINRLMQDELRAYQNFISGGNPEAVNPPDIVNQPQPPGQPGGIQVPQPPAPPGPQPPPEQAQFQQRRQAWQQMVEAADAEGKEFTPQQQATLKTLDQQEAQILKDPRLSGTDRNRALLFIQEARERLTPDQKKMTPQRVYQEKVMELPDGNKVTVNQHGQPEIMMPPADSVQRRERELDSNIRNSAMVEWQKLLDRGFDAAQATAIIEDLFKIELPLQMRSAPPLPAPTQSQPAPAPAAMPESSPTAPGMPIRRQTLMRSDMSGVPIEVDRMAVQQQGEMPPDVAQYINEMMQRPTAGIGGPQPGMAPVITDVEAAMRARPAPASIGGPMGVPQSAVESAVGINRSAPMPPAGARPGMLNDGTDPFAPKTDPYANMPADLQELGRMKDTFKQFRDETRDRPIRKAAADLFNLKKKIAAGQKLTPQDMQVRDRAVEFLMNEGVLSP